MKKEAILRKIKHLLGASKEDIDFLSDLDKENLNKLYLQIAKSINEGQMDIWQQLAKVNHYVPSFLAAKLAQNIFGESVCANVASYMKVKDALSVMNHLTIDFMAKVAGHIIPEKNIELVNAISLKKLRKISHILLNQKDYYTLAGFVDTLELSKVLLIANEDINENKILLEIASYVEDKNIVAEIFTNFSKERKLQLIIDGYNNSYREELQNTIVHLPKNELELIQTFINQLPDEIREQVEEDLRLSGS